MAETTTTTFMTLVLPVPGVRSGLDSASDNNTAFQTIDSHDHSSGKGVKITPAGMNINADLSFGSFQAISLKTSVFDSQSASLSSSFKNAVYVAGGDLYFNNSSGTAIQLTSAGTINVGSVQGISGLASPASATYSAPTFTYKSAATTYGKVSHSDLNIYEATAGITNAVTIKSPTSLAASYTLTLPSAAPGSTSYVSMDSSGNLSTVSADTIAAAVTATGANNILNVYTRATGSTVAARGFAISSSSGLFTTTSSSFVDVTNLSVTITTNGRPVFVGLVGDNGSSVCYIGQIGDGSASTSRAEFKILNNTSSTIVGYHQTQVSTGAVAAVTVTVPSSSLYGFDQPIAGTYTYKVQALAAGGTATTYVARSKLIAYEI